MRHEQDSGEALTTSQLGPRLRGARERLGVSQRALAKLVGYDNSAIAHIEAGRKEPSLGKLVAMANELHVSADYLLGVGGVQ